MKLLLICNPGGHFYNDGTENFGLPTQGSGSLTPNLTLKHYVEVVYWVEMQEARMLWRACVNFLKALYILRKSQPDLVVSTGASIAVPFLLASKLFGIKTVFIEYLPLK